MSRAATGGPRPGDLGGPQRILVYGVTGSGKTTLARSIGGATGLPWHAVDELTWEPGWVSAPDDVQRERIAAICAGDRWVLDHAYGKWVEVVMDRVDLVVGLDYPRWLSLGRLVRRTIGRVITREEQCNGNVETVGKVFAQDSIIRWHFRSYASKRDRLRGWEQDAAMPPILRLTHPKLAEAWLRSLSR